MIYIDEILKQKVANVSVSLQRDIYFMHGHPLEIISELKELAQAPSTKAKRYPLVALFRDFNESKGNEVGISTEPTLNIIIATRTEPTYNSDKRKEVSFKPILHPIWEGLEQEILWGKEFLTNATGLEYTQIDRYYWGRESIYGSEGNIFTDHIDAVEIRNLNLKIKQKNC